MKDNELIKFANNLASTQKAKDITDFYNNLPAELDDTHKVELIKLEFYSATYVYSENDEWLDDEW